MEEALFACAKSQAWFYLRFVDFSQTWIVSNLKQQDTSRDLSKLNLSVCSQMCPLGLGRKIF